MHTCTCGRTCTELLTINKTLPLPLPLPLHLYLHTYIPTYLHAYIKPQPACQVPKLVAMAEVASWPLFGQLCQDAWAPLKREPIRVPIMLKNRVLG